MSRFLNLALVLFVALSFAACQSGKGKQDWRATGRLTTTLAEDTTNELSALGYFSSSDVDYESVDISLGAIRYSEDNRDTIEDESKPEMMVDFQVGFVDVDDSQGGIGDAIELSAGLRYYVFEVEPFEGYPIHGYVSGYAVHTDLEDVGPIESDAQIGLRVGGGAQVFLTDDLYLDLALDYTRALIPAESAFNATFMDEVDSELDGLALRFGVGFFF